MSWEQYFIVALSMPAAFLAGSAVHRTRRWAYVFGLCAQPFWVWMAYSGRHWGVLAMAGFYTFTWGRGLYNHWLCSDRRAHAVLAEAQPPQRHEGVDGGCQLPE